MKLRKRMAAYATVATMAFATIVSPITANAEASYNPTIEGYNGVYIDTKLVPTNNNDIKISGETIEAKRNVKFQLDANVDVTWSVKADDAGATGVSVEKSGLVRITKTATPGFYTVTAKTLNVPGEAAQTITKKIKVTDGTAQPTNIVLDEEKIEEEYYPALEVSGEPGKQVLTATGYVQGELYATVEPEYINDDEYWFQNDDSNNVHFQNYDPESESGKCFYTKKTTTENGKMLGFSKSKTSSITTFDVVVKPETYHFNLLNSNEKVPDDGKVPTTYSFSMNQEADLSVDENSLMALTAQGRQQITSAIKWTVNQNNETVSAENGVYTINGQKQDANGKYVDAKVAEIKISEDGKSIEVKTEDIEGSICNDVTLKAEYSLNNNDDSHKDFTLKFNKNIAAEVNAVDLDFEKYGWEEDVDFSVYEEIISGEKKTVYYLEEGKGMNLPELTYGNVSGTRSFEDAKEIGFTKNTSYPIDYKLSAVDGISDSYLNDTLLKGNQVLQSGIIGNPKELELVGTGYVKLTVSPMPGGKIAESKDYIIRVVSSASKLAENLSITRNGQDSYFIKDDINENEVVHIRQGEAVVPRVSGKAVSLTDPFMEYTFAKEGIVNVVRDKNGNTRLSGLNEGKVLVTATSTVNKKNFIDFWVYVNKDAYSSETDEAPFEISVHDAIEEGTVTKDSSNEKFVVQGRQDEVKLGLNAVGNNSGIPAVTWSIDCTEDYAVIDSETGVITTKKSTKIGKPITVTATNKKNSSQVATATFTIAEVNATGIKELSEKIENGSVGVVTSLGKNAGKVTAGKSFTLYASSFIPENATRIEAGYDWKSKDEKIATVDENGKVTAVAEGTTTIIVNYTTDGTTTSVAEYDLTVEKGDIPVSSIEAKDVELTKIGDTATISVSVLPENATNKRITFKSSDDKIVKVNEAGQVTGISVGDATITITSEANSSIVKTVTVKVKGEADKDITTEAPTTQAPKTEAPTTQAPTTQAPKTEVPTTQAPVAEKVTVPATKIKSAKNAKGKKITIKLNKVSDAKYQIVYGTNKNFKGAKKITVSKTTYTIKKLKSGKTYYIKARALKTVNGKKVYSKYTTAKKVTIKK